MAKANKPKVAKFLIIEDYAPGVMPIANEPEKITEEVANEPIERTTNVANQPVAGSPDQSLKRKLANDPARLLKQMERAIPYRLLGHVQKNYVDLKGLVDHPAQYPPAIREQIINRVKIDIINAYKAAEDKSPFTFFQTGN